jgi:hypothetical protein
MVSFGLVEPALVSPAAVLYRTLFAPRLKTTLPGMIVSEGVELDFVQVTSGPVQIVAARLESQSIWMNKPNRTTREAVVKTEKLYFLVMSSEV